jgi:NAD(P)-dependent dehydrogenase (short-subunit alcohol dehydrogenase family)
MDSAFKGKVAMVTGAARGMGLKCAEMLAEGGAKVALVDIREDLLIAATKQVAKKGEARSYTLDITKVSAINRVVSRIRKDLGEIDILVQAAGIGPARPADEITELEWDAVLATNTKGLFFCMQAVTNQCMIPRNSGAIVNFASIAGMVAMPRPMASAHYHASKAGVIQLTRQGAIEWAQYNIRVNAVAPGGVPTEMTKEFLGTPAQQAAVARKSPLGRLSTPADIGAVVCFLASDAARMITGVTVPVDGGYTAQ